MISAPVAWSFGRRCGARRPGRAMALRLVPLPGLAGGERSFLGHRDHRRMRRGRRRLPGPRLA